MKSLLDYEKEYENTADYHKKTVESFNMFVNGSPYLKEHRDFVEQHVYGFGERSFHWMWKLIIQEMPTVFNFLEIGVYKGQVLSLVRLIANKMSKTPVITGITPLSSFSGFTNKYPAFPDDDYSKHIENLHNHFNLEQPIIVKGLSTDMSTFDKIAVLAPFDIVYVDGCHEYDSVVFDLTFYSKTVKIGGYLVVDDASNNLNMYNGSFPGIQDVSDAVKDTIENNDSWKQVFVVMHNRIFRRIK